MASYYDDTSYKKEPIFPINRIGTTVLLNGQNGDPVQALKAEIFAGAGNVEICAPGTGASNQGMQFTFEGIEADQRQAMRELAKINNVQITTHSSFRVGNLAGLGEGGYKEQNRKMSVDEVKKAIDFAADATMGGSVVVHTGELPRPLAGDRLINKGGAKFSSHNKEADEAVYHLIDPESGKVISSVHADGIIYEPVADSKNPYLLDSDGKKPLVNPVIKQLIMERIQADPSSKYRNKKFDDLPLDMKESAYVKNLVVDPETKTIRTNSITFDEFAKKLRQTKADITNEQVAKEFFKRQSDAELQQALGQSMEYEKNYLDTREKREKKLQELQKFKELQDNPLAIRDQEVKQINSQISMFKQALPRVEDPEQKKEVEEEIQRLQMQSDNLKTMSESELKRNAAESLKKKRQEIDETERTMQYHQEVAVGGKLKAREVLKKIDNARDIQDYALEQSAKSISELGIYAMQQTERARAERKGDKIQPIMITLENIFP
ncbi:MAG TPA: hypothetical protein VK158_05125, partial [Acidobacteriota bacterium]|nr:hypothetical protein [Acidobacteriota bacterium]